MNNFLKRTMTAFILIVLLAWILRSGSRILEFAVLFFSLELCHELSSAFKHKGSHIPEHIILLACLLHYTVFQFQWPWFIAFAFPLFFFILYYLRDNQFRIEDMGICFLILIYVPTFLFPLLLLDKTRYLYLVFVISIATDTFAYLTGMSLGKHKLCPSISPNKTVEGAIGGVVGTLICGTVYCFLFDIRITFLHVLFIGIASVMAQLGDLFASKIKRATGIKDFGHLLPGHGGFMDRFDSMLLIVPMVYMLYHFAL
ncbi:MAG: phosphatidate cytidylyltransferase [Peptoniphilus sp.]|nr:phosphatidate cytidylyltransferase [Peptoniphilus sp.]MDY3119305.1 phosphatidate cytidylyltransferase [Peptoniphilus sp.]